MIIFVFIFFNTSFSQVKIRIYADQRPETVFIKVLSDSFSVDLFNGTPLDVEKGETFVLQLYGNKVAVKLRNKPGFSSDSIKIQRANGDGLFSVITENELVKRDYTGALIARADLASLLLINITDSESYLAGVVRSEGGSGKSSEYFRTQAIIARTYTIRYSGKHLKDRFNLCDGTHCQAYGGLTNDRLISRAVQDTRDLVITSPDSIPIISAFHSNCGGETAPSEYVWLTAEPYLVKVKDPFCVESRGSDWLKNVSLGEWTGMLMRNGYSGSYLSSADFNFNQASRTRDYRIGSFDIPFQLIRNELGLRSSWFSVTASGDTLTLKGRGYGHGVGLCQEGAMVMARNGKSFREIIEFYYPGVMIIKVSETKTVKTGTVRSDI